MKTVDIKGKPYVEVSERIKYFRENYKHYALTSELVKDEAGKCIIKATVLDQEGDVKATGYAYEKEGEGYINKTSYIENCETSAWGRALANFGIGIDAAVASADEVKTAIAKQSNQAEFGKADDDDKEIAQLKKALAKAVSDMILTPDAMGETIKKAEEKTGDELVEYSIRVQQHLSKLKKEATK